MRTYVFSLFLLLISGSGCSPGDSSLSEAQRNQIESEVSAMMDDLVAGVTAIDLDHAFTHYDPNDFLAFNQGSQFRSAEAFKAAWRPGFENTATWAVRWTWKDITPLSAQAALFRGTTSVSQTLKDSQTTLHREGYVTVLAERKGDGWTITHFHQSWKEVDPSQ